MKDHTTILLIRHGETAWNAVRRLQGHIDIPLNAEGERQAAALARALAGEKLDAIVSSDLQRAMQTARAVAAQHNGLALRTDPQLRERAYGVFEGMLYNDIQDEYPADFALWQGRDVDAVICASDLSAGEIRKATSPARGDPSCFSKAVRAPGGASGLANQMPRTCNSGIWMSLFHECCAPSLESVTPLGVPTITKRNSSVSRTCTMSRSIDSVSRTPAS